MSNGSRVGEREVMARIVTEEELVRLMALQREGPVQISRIAIGQSLRDESRTAELVEAHLARLREEGRWQTC